MSDNDVEDVSFLPGDNLNRKSRYEPSVKQKCKRLVLGQGRATAIVVILGIFILIITVIASLARPGSSGSCPQSDKPLTTRSPSQEKQYKDEHGKTFPWQDIRLPKTLLPEQYHIFLHPDLLNKKFTGEVTITIRVKTSTDMVILHSRKLSIDKCEVMLFNEDRKVRKIGVEKTSMQSTLEMLAIHLEEKIASGKTIVVNIKFHAKLENKLTGFYLSSFRTPDGRTEYLGVTQFEAVGARQAFPCFDEPEMKAKFSLSIVREKNQITLFNMPLDRTNAHETDKQLEVDSYPETVKMSSYLVAFAVLSGYGSISGSTKQGTKVGVYAPKFQMNQTDHALKSAITILNFYDDWFGIKYPLPKQDLVAIPDFAAGAMENWGLITYRLVEILYDPDVSSIYRKQRVTTVIAHELAHQWFGNLVTMKWWDDLWLNEGFATFVEYLGTDKVDPSFQVMQQFLSGDMLRALESDSLRNSHPVSATVKDPNQIDSIFDAISYSKGSSIIRMAKGFIGDANFKEGLRSYLNTYKYGNAESTDLWNSLHKAYDKKDVSAVMDTWTKQMGYPVITVTKDKGGSTATLSQKRFLLGGGESTQSSPFGFKWYVPFWYTIKPEKGGFKDSLVWLNMDSATIKIPPGSKFIKGNYGMLGFYRVNYDEDNWNAINKALMENHQVLEPEDRAGIVDDLFALARSNEVSQSLALNMTRYLKSEDSYIVWHAALKGFHFLDHMLYSKDAFDILKAYVLGLMENALQKIGWEPPKTVLDSYLQQELLKRALYYDHQKTKEEARRKFRDWKDKDKEVVPNVKFVVYSAGVKYGDHKDWEFVMNKYITSTVPSEKMTLLSALAATQNIRRVEKLLEYSLDSTKIRPQDFSHVIRYLAGNPTAHLTTWHFVRTNWDNIMKMLNGAGFVIKSIIKSTTGRFAAEFDLNEVKSFFDSHEAGSGAGQVRQSIESIKMNIAWKKQNLLTVTQWLQDNSKEQ